MFPTVCAACHVPHCLVEAFAAHVTMAVGLIDNHVRLIGNLMTVRWSDFYIRHLPHQSVKPAFDCKGSKYISHTVIVARFFQKYTHIHRLQCPTL